MNILVIAPHPDDEILGCGGTLLKHQNCGDQIHIVYMTEIQEKYGHTKEQIDRRNLEIESILGKLDAKSYFMGYPTATLNDVDIVDLVPKLSEIFKKVAPNIVYLPHRSDAHSDHGISFKAAYSCTKNFRCPSIKTILVYETVSETEFAPAYASDVFIPNYFIDISDFIIEKVELMQIYSSELGDPPFPRSIQNLKALSSLRGSSAGVLYAEAFHLLKLIN